MTLVDKAHLFDGRLADNAFPGPDQKVSDGYADFVRAARAKSEAVFRIANENTHDAAPAEERELSEAEAERHRRHDPLRRAIAEAEDTARESDERARSALKPIADCRRMSKAARGLALEKAMSAFVESWAASRCAALLQAELDRLEAKR